MINTGEEKYQKGLDFFEECNYLEAMKSFIEAYNEGFNCETIVSDIYNCFINPNQDEFMQNYMSTSLSDKDVFDKLAIDFIPVSEDTFFSYNQVDKSFGDMFVVGEKHKQSDMKEFGSLLISNICKADKIISAITLKNWSKVYILIDKCKYEFYSLFKLPNFEKLYMDKVIIFDKEEDFINYFKQNKSIYLPKSIISNDNEKYQNIINDLHKERITDMDTENDNVFLSICIPTYNRGDIALNTVKNLLELKYDSEIEIVISNNGSTENTDGYEVLKGLKDNRIRYFEFEENQGYASNVRKVLMEARGKFAVTTSDEDLMIIENLGKYMTYLLNNMDVGFIFSTGYGPNFGINPEHVYKQGLEAVTKAINSNYITGLTFNMRCFKERNVIARFDSNRGNRYLEDYAHCVMAMMTSEKTDVIESGIILWNAEEDEKPEDGQVRIMVYTRPENRIIQQNTAIEVLYNVIEMSPDVFIEMFMERVQKTYFLIRLAYIIYEKAYANEYKWSQVCKMLHENNLDLADKYFSNLGAELYNQINDILVQIFLQYLKDDFLDNILDGKDKLIHNMLVNIIIYRIEQGISVCDIDIELIEKQINQIIE